jgi:DNA-binding GntR family transcriptional regulator
MSSSNESLSRQLVEEIGMSILAGELEPGTKLTEAGLAKKLGVNRAPLREALTRLEERQLIERVPFTGMRVAKPGLKNILELYEICETLEGLSARHAASRITDEEIAHLGRILDASEERVRTLGAVDSRLLPTHRDFHTEIVRIGGNRELELLLGREIWVFLRVVHQRWTRTMERLQQACIEHRRILEALSDRDPDMAELAMRRHIRNIRKTLEKTADLG